MAWCLLQYFQISLQNSHFLEARRWKWLILIFLKILTPNSESPFCEKTLQIGRKYRDLSTPTTKSFFPLCDYALFFWYSFYASTNLSRFLGKHSIFLMVSDTQPKILIISCVMVFCRVVIDLVRFLKNTNRWLNW